MNMHLTFLISCRIVEEKVLKSLTLCTLDNVE